MIEEVALKTQSHHSACIGTLTLSQYSPQSNLPCTLQDEKDDKEIHTFSMPPLEEQDDKGIQTFSMPPLEEDTGHVNITVKICDVQTEQELGSQEILLVPSLLGQLVDEYEVGDPESNALVAKVPIAFTKTGFKEGTGADEDEDMSVDGGDVMATVKKQEGEGCLQVGTHEPLKFV